MPKVPISHVADDEILYRRILNGMGLYEIQADGTVLFDSQAFAERSCSHRYIVQSYATMILTKLWPDSLVALRA